MTYATIPDFSGGTTLTATELNVIVDAINALFPVGFYGYMCRAATTAETLVNGVWLECNGLSVLRATYPDLNTLFSSLSYPFGTADGTHMTLPDFQGRAPVSMSSGGHTNNDGLADSDGIAKASRNQKASISVSVSGTTGGGSAHSHSVTLPGAATATAGASGGYQGSGSLTTGTESSHTHSFSGSGSGAQTGPYLVGGTRFIKCKA